MKAFLSKLPVHQLLNQLIFLFVGKFVYKLSVTWPEIAAVLIFSVLLEHALLFARDGRRLSYSPAALSTGFNLAFMLGTTATWVYFIALLVGLGQKHLFKRLSGEHFLNPSNIGITAALLLFPNYTYVTFIDWGVTVWFALLVAGLGTLILWRVGLVFVPYLFLAAYAAFAFLLHTHNVHEILLRLASAGFLLFAFFMITDPKATPGSRPFLAAHAVLTAFLCNLLPLLLGPKDVNLFLALTISGILVPLWRHLERPALRRYRLGAFASFATVLTLIAAAAYFSPWNVMRNVMKSRAEHQRPTTLAVVLPPPRPTAVTDPAEVWSTPDAELYPAQWVTGHVVKRPFNPQRGAQARFQPQPLPGYPATLKPEMLGDETSLYAGVAVGDINADGYPDAILSRIGGPLAVFINNRQGGFLDLTGKLFPLGAPANVEHAALADFNNDGRLDLLLVYSQYYGEKKPAAIFWFEPEREQFVPSPFEHFAAGKKTSGGISVADVNGDGTLDFYISFGIDWFSEDTRKTIAAARHVLYVSGPRGWDEQYTRYFEPYLTQNQYAGMTALFTDFTGDGALDFLLGNDFDDPSFALVGKRGARGFDLLTADQLENNTQNSMSYFPLDTNNDGVYELWENGISEALTPGRLALEKKFEKPHRSVINQELERLEKERALGQYGCETYQNPLAASLCRDAANNANASLTNNRLKCDAIEATGARHACHWWLNSINHIIDIPSPAEHKYDVEKFPKQLRENVLLQLTPSTGRYTNILKNSREASHTGFTWCAYPFDVNNDGLLDLYLTTGMPNQSHDYNHLLINHTQRTQANQYSSADPGQSKVSFSEEAPVYGVDSENDGRGAVIADFDLDGDGDLLINNYLVEPEYYENLSGGRSLLIELRSRTANYYAIGATIRLITNADVQIRSVDNGGHWDTSQPTVQHFGLGAADTVQAVEVTWPKGNVTRYTDFEPGFRYVIFE